jgi:cyanate lyase
MALFFDAPWFDAKLEERDLSRAVMAAVAGLSEAELALVFKDQQELSAGQVAAFAELLGVPAAEIADRARISTPRPGAAPPTDARIAALERRVAALEAEIAKLRSS